MLQISQLRMVLDHDDEALKAAAARELRVPIHFIRSLVTKQRAIDARRGNVEFSYTVLVSLLEEEAVLRRMTKNTRVCVAPSDDYTQLEGVPAVTGKENRPIVVGSGPCGLFAALLLARHGMRPILLERGKPAGERARDVTGFWRRNWPFNPDSNVQYGEGGAGTFSDGKLYTQIRDRENRIPWVLRELVKAGAPEDILVNNRPHIGTDRLIKVVRTIREEIIALGGDVRFESRVADVGIKDGVMKSVTLASGEVIESDHFVFAVGHSARDTFELLHKRGVPFEAKPFSVGVRIEHPQKVIDHSQYGRFAGHPKLGAASYRFVVHCSTGRSAYSFCMCPGGLVVSSPSEPETVVTNGMSSYARE